MSAPENESELLAEHERPLLALRARSEPPTHCFFLANAQRASVMWTRDDFRALCHRMLNGNGEHEFLLCYRDAQDKVRFSKAYRAKASARIDWAFDTICRTAKQKTGIGFYPCNGDDESCWGALDFLGVPVSIGHFVAFGLAIEYVRT
jgi:hypothetical protein